MSFAVMAILLPLLAAVPLGVLGQPGQGARANLVLNGLVFLLTTIVGYAPGLGLVHADALGTIFGILTGFVGLTTAIGNLAFVGSGVAMMSVRRWRLYHAMCQTVLGMTLLGLYADNIGLLWAAVEGGTMAAAVGVGLPCTVPALQAAWKSFLLGGVGIALALFGTMLTYLAAQPALGPGLNAMSLLALSQNAARLDGPLLALAFVFLLFGYGARAALVPLHGWLPDACTEGPAPLAATLGVPALNVALIAILRFRHLLQGSFAAGHSLLQPGPFLLVLGLASLLLTGVSLARRRDTRHFFGFASVAHSGLAVFAFGIGGAAAIFGGLLHMILHTLATTALFQALTRGAILRGGAGPGQFGFSRLRGMIGTNKYLAWMLGASVFALAGLPPSGLFVSEYLIISQTALRMPWLIVPLLLGLLLCAAAMIRGIGPLVFGPAPSGTVPYRAGRGSFTTALHLLLAVALGFAMPAALVASLSTVSAALQ